MKIAQPSDPRTSPLIALRRLMPLPPEPDREANEEAKLIHKLELKP